MRLRNLETILGPLVLHVVRTGELPRMIDIPQRVRLSWPELWRECPRWREVKVDDGSENHRAMASVLGLYHPGTREEALESWRVWAEINRTIGFQGCEPDSRIYGGWTLACHLLAYRWASGIATQDAESAEESLASFLDDWLSLWWVRRRLALWDSPVGPWSLHPGSRSGGHGILQTPMDYADSLAGLGSTSWVWRNGRGKTGKKYGANQYWEKGEAEMWCLPAFTELWREISETAAPVIRPGGVSIAGTPAWPCLNQVNYLRTSQGLACWCESKSPGEDAVVNSNTSGIVAMGWEEGMELPWALPEGGGPRIRQHRVVEACVSRDINYGLSPSQRFPPYELYFERIEEGRPSKGYQVQRLPPGEVLSWVRHTENGLEVVR